MKSWAIRSTAPVITLTKAVMFLGAFVSLSVCVHDYSKTNKCILMKFFIWGKSDQGKK